MSSGSLRYTLVVRHPENGVATALVEGSEVPDWAKDLVHQDDLEPATKAPVKKAAASKSEK